MWFAAGMEGTLSLLMKLLGPFIGILVGWYWGKFQARSEWEKKEFKSNIVLSLNMLDLYEEPEEDGPVGSLKLRTLFERDLSEVFPNEAMEQMVRDAGDETKPGDPILRFPKEDSWFLLNSILNQIAEQFAVGTVRSDMGLDVERCWYTFCVTFEHDERVHQFKPRILIMKREHFLNFPDAGDFDLEVAHHDLRIETLRKLKRDRQHNPHLFMDLELSL